MKFIFRLVAALIIIILVAFISIRIFVPKTIVSQAQLYSEANKFIESQPSESQVSVRDIFASYRQLELRWVGKDNALINHQQIAHNPIFAATRMFESDYLPESQLSVKYSRVKYTTQLYGKSREVSGLVLIPQHQAIKGVVLYFHSTISGKLNVPSLHFNEYKTEMLAAIFAANGYIVVAPDYLGLGDDYQDTHPYILYPEPNIEDGKNMILATLPILRKSGDISSDKLLPLFVGGYSEGGSYALWFSRIYQQNNAFRQAIEQQKLHLSHTVAIEGAYDLSNVMLPFLLSNQYNESNNQFQINTTFWGSFLKPSLMVNALLAFAAANHTNAAQLFNSDFYNLDCFLGLPLCGSAHNIDSLRVAPTNQFKIALNYFFAALLQSESNTHYSPLNNSVVPLINSNVLQDKLLLTTAQKADILSWKSNNPITLVSLANDSLVPQQNSANAYQQMKLAGSQNINYIKVDNNLIHARSIFGPSIADHVSFELYALLIALQQFDSH